MKLKSLISFCTILLASLVFSQQNKVVKHSIPMDFVKENHVMIKGVVNDKDTLNLFFDTGATASLIDSATAKKLNIIPDYEKSVDGAGGKKTYKVALNQEMIFNDIRLDSVNLVIEDLTRLRASFDHPFDGIIGYDIIKNYITELNFSDEMIYLYPKNSKIDYSNYSEHDFTFDKGIPIPQLNIEIELNDYKKHTGKVFFDSGAGLTLLVNTPFNKKYKLDQSASKKLTSTSNNLSKESVSQQIAIRSLSLGKYNFSDMPIDLASDESGVSSYEGYLGILGAEIINKFDFILDYDKKKFYLRPNYLFEKKFKFPLSGFSINKNDEGNIYISQIAEESPAYKKGLRKGDIVLSINNDKSKSLKDLKQLLDKEGERIKLKVKKGKCAKTYRIRLKRLL